MLGESAPDIAVRMCVKHTTVYSAMRTVEALVSGARDADDDEADPPTWRAGLSDTSRISVVNHRPRVAFRKPRKASPGP